MSKIYEILTLIILEVPFLIAASLGAGFLSSYFTHLILYRFFIQSEYTLLPIISGLLIGLILGYLLNKLYFFILSLVSSISKPFIPTRAGFVANLIFLTTTALIFSFLGSVAYI